MGGTFTALSVAHALVRAASRLISTLVSSVTKCPKQFTGIQGSKKPQMTPFSSSRCWVAILFAGSVSFIAYAQSKLLADVDPQSRARLPYLKKSDMDAKGQKISHSLLGSWQDVGSEEVGRHLSKVQVSG